jgi:hypothetical protein
MMNGRIIRNNWSRRDYSAVHYSAKNRFSFVAVAMGCGGKPAGVYNK